MCIDSQDFSAIILTRHKNVEHRHKNVESQKPLALVHPQNSFSKFWLAKKWRVACHFKPVCSFATRQKMASTAKKWRVPKNLLHSFPVKLKILKKNLWRVCVHPQNSFFGSGGWWKTKFNFFPPTSWKKRIFEIWKKTMKNYDIKHSQNIPQK